MIRVLRPLSFGVFAVFTVVVVSVVGCSSSTEPSRSGGHPDAGVGGASWSAGTGETGGASGASGATAMGDGGSSRARDAATETGPKDGASDALLADADDRADAGGGAHFLWQLFYGQSFAAHVVVDSAGAPIVSGTFFDTRDVTLGAFTLTSKGAADIMLSRVLPSGAVDWARSYGAASEDYPISFVLDATNRITLSGLYDGAGNVGGADFPTFAGTPGRYDVYAAGLTSKGDYRWQTTINTTADCFAGPGLAVNAASDLFVVGQFEGTATIGGIGHVSAGSWDAYFARFDGSSGALSAVLTFGGVGDDRAVAAVLTPTDVLVFGTFDGQVTFPTTPPKTVTSNGGRDVYIARLSMNGAMQSVVSFGGTGDEDLTGARRDTDGSIVIAGSFASPTLSILGGKPLASAGANDLFVARLASDLSPKWSAGFGGSADDRMRDVALGPGGEIAVTGEFRDEITFGARTHEAARGPDAGPTEIDAFLAKLNRDGTPLWTVSAGGPLPDRGLGVAMDTGGAVYLTASFQSATQFGGDVLTPEPGQWASALVKYAP